MSPWRAWRFCGRRARWLAVFQVGLAGINLWAATLGGVLWPLNAAVGACCLVFGYIHLRLGCRAAAYDWWARYYARRANAKWN